MTQEVTETAAQWGRRILREIRRQPYTGDEVKWFGQAAIMKQIKPFLFNQEPFPHTILLGEPGLGKTHLARYIAYVRDEAFEEILAPVDPMAMPTRGVVLLDEVHRQRSPEVLFQAMKYEVPTIIAATTRPEMVDKAFRSRFFLELHLRPYEPEDMKLLVGSHLGASEETLEALGYASGGNPRQAERLALVAERLGTTDVEVILSTCHITGDGLTIDHIEYLRLLVKMKKPVGLSQIVTLLYMDETTVKQLERLLLDLDLIQLNQNGRKITRAGTDYVREFDKN